MAGREARDGKSGASGHPPKAELGYMASDNYKARLTKGLLGVTLGEGYIVEVVNYRSKRVLRRELFDEADEARQELAVVREDIGRLTTEDFRRKYLQSQE